MTKLITNPEYNLYERDGKAFCSSRQIAQEFSRRHDDVMNGIEKEISNILKTNNRTFSDINFLLTTYKDARGRQQKEYLLSKDGFLSVVLKYSGQKATALRIAYIQRFNEMESFIKSLLTTKEEFPAFTNAVLMAHAEPKHYHFSNEINMIYRVVMGMDATAVREERGIEKGASIRPFLNSYEIKAVEELQRADIGLLVSVPDYGERKDILKEYLRNLVNRKRLAA